MSFTSMDVCARIIQAKLHADILVYLSWDTLSARTLDDPQSANKSQFIDKQMGILHSVVRKVERARGSCRQLNAVEILQKFRYTTKYPVVTHNFAFRLGPILL